MAIYLAFIVWFVLILLMGLGVHRLLVSLFPARYVAWVLLPGTLVSELAYVVGSLVTGGQVRRLSLFGSRSRGAGGETSAEASPHPKLGALGSVLAGMLALMACVGALVGLWVGLGEPVLKDFYVHVNRVGLAELPRSLPDSWRGFWGLLGDQVGLLRRSTETIRLLDWSDWRAWVFVYVASCIVFRMVPVRKELRWYLAGVVVAAGIVAVIGAVAGGFGVIADLWPLLNFLYAVALLWLAVWLLVHAVVWLVRVLAGKDPAR